MFQEQIQSIFFFINKTLVINLGSVAPNCLRISQSNEFGKNVFEKIFLSKREDVTVNDINFINIQERTSLYKNYKDN